MSNQLGFNILDCCWQQVSSWGAGWTCALGTAYQGGEPTCHFAMAMVVGYRARAEN